MRLRRMSILLSALITMVCLAGSVVAEQAIAPPLKRLPEYERCVFAVRWLGVRVGTITAAINGIKKIGGRDAYELEATAKTNDLCSRIYPVNDRYVSYMDTEKLCTLRHEVYRREGRYKKDAITDFDQANNKAYFRNLLDGSTKTIDIPPGVQDSLSAGYYFRMIPVELGRKVEFSVYNNEAVYRLIGIADRLKRLRLGVLGMKEAFHIQPYALLKGKTVKKGKANGYFSCDEKRLPLRVHVKAPVFTEVTGSLEKMD